MDLPVKLASQVSDYFYLVSVSYDGSGFAGWAKQPTGVTVQGFIETRISSIFKRKVTILASSRTDRGVHALDQRFTFKINIDFTNEQLTNLLKRSLGDCISVNKVKRIDPSFHPIHDVLFKEYRYYIRNEEPNIFFNNYYWYYNHPLRLTKLRKTLEVFEGHHDFFNFSYCRKRDRETTNTRREIQKITVSQHGNLFTIKFLAKGFLRYQIRAIVGEAVYYSGISDDNLLALSNRLQPGVDSKYKRIAPPAGLYLWRITMKGSHSNGN